MKEERAYAAGWSFRNKPRWQMSHIIAG